MRAIVFGGGTYGKLLKRGLERYCGVETIAICDNDSAKWGNNIDDVPVIAPQQLLTLDFDKIFICIRKGNMFRSVETQLIEMGISKDKIVIMQRSTEYQDAFLECDPNRKKWIRDFAEYTRELGLTGNVAECGVYYGETAMFINKYWPDRLLYLCDTWEGFADKDVTDEKEKFVAFEKGTFTYSGFKAETPELLIDTVKVRMLYPEKVHVYQGRFPESIGDVEDQFCFVNLDMDLYSAQLSGLRFFWNKMEIGG